MYINFVTKDLRRLIRRCIGFLPSTCCRHTALSAFTRERCAPVTHEVAFAIGSHRAPLSAEELVNALHEAASAKNVDNSSPSRPRGPGRRDLRPAEKGQLRRVIKLYRQIQKAGRDAARDRPGDGGARQKNQVLHDAGRGGPAAGAAALGPTAARGRPAAGLTARAHRHAARDARQRRRSRRPSATRASGASRSASNARASRAV